MLNAQQILDEGLLKLDHAQGKPAQVGYDLTLKQVNKIGVVGNGYHSRIGKVLKDKTELTTYTPYPLINLDGATGWLLYQGTYDITFNEGCKLSNNRVAFIKQRSSLYRNGTIINSPVFDPNFETEFMGTLMYVHETIFIEENARVAQIYFYECTPVPEDQLYNGQFQGDTWRKEHIKTSI
jgi:deoxycytidine triphosphate deaminase